MSQMIHGGDIYNNRIELDFSVNLNPLGTPEPVKNALVEAMANIGEYPDIEYSEVRRIIGENNGLSAECVLPGNGASECFMAIAKTVNPGKALINEPAFYGYRYALESIPGCEIGETIPENITEEMLAEVNLIFLNDPVNPTGKNLGDDYIRNVLEKARGVGAYVVLDESFYYLSDKAASGDDIGNNISNEIGNDFHAARLLSEFDNLIIVRSYTKLFAIPGVRIGYMLSSRENIAKISKHLPEWNLSCFASKAAVVCERMMNVDFCTRTYEYIRSEREFLEAGLSALGMKVYPGDTSYLMIKAEPEFKEKLLERGILIRDCSNFKTLEKGHFRIAVKDHESNVRLLETIGEII